MGTCNPKLGKNFVPRLAFLLLSASALFLFSINDLNTVLLFTLRLPCGTILYTHPKLFSFPSYLHLSKIVVVVVVVDHTHHQANTISISISIRQFDDISLLLVPIKQGLLPTRLDRQLFIHDCACIQGRL